MVGFALFAGFLMILGGAFQIIEGLAALLSGGLFIVTPAYIYHLTAATWGWIHLLLGIILVLAGIAVFSGKIWGRILGIILAGLSAIANFFYIPYYPFWAILIIIIDIVIIWALAGYTPEEAGAKKR